MKSTRLEFTDVPGSRISMLKSVVSRKRGLRGEGTIPRIEASIAQVGPQPQRVSEYRRLCGFPETEYLPPTYPHILASPLHLVLATHKEFPIPAMGIVHIGNEIVQQRPIRDDEDLQIACHVEGHRDSDLGVEFDIVTNISAGGEPVWESSSTVLSRAKKRTKRERTRRQQDDPTGDDRSIIFGVPEWMGRRYGKVSGDFNPIHVHVSTAKLFGFKRAIAHGMWSLARCVAELEDEIAYPTRIAVRFKTPIYLPSKVLFRSAPSATGEAFFVSDPHSGKPHLEGEISERSGEG